MMKTNTNRTLFTYQKISTAAAFLLLAVLIVFPLLMIFRTAIDQNGVIDLMAPLRLLGQSDLTSVMFSTLWLGCCVIVTTTVLALPLAWMMAKTAIGRQRWLDVVFLIPFMTPPYIGSMGWMLFMQKNGYMEQILPASAKITPAFFSFGGMVMIMSLHLFPFLYLILRNTLEQIGGSTEEAASVHGASFGYRFRRIILPLLLSSYAMGALLIFVKTIAEFGTPATFGRKIGFYVMTSEIHKYISSWPIDFGKATSLASLLLTACLLMWYIQSILSSRYSYRLTGGKGSRSKKYSLRGWSGIVCWLYISILLITSIGIPYFSVITASLLRLRGTGLAVGNFTLEHYKDLLSFGSESMEALINSFTLSLIAATIAVLIGTFLALKVGQGKRWSQKGIDLFSLMPNTVPGIVIVVGLILFWNSPWMPIPLYNSYGMVVLTYIILFLPYTLQYVKANNGQIDPILLQAGAISGGHPLYVFRRILLPLLLPGMIAGWTMTFTIANRELVASLLILPPSMQTSATYIFAQFEQGAVSMGMAMAVVSVGITTILLLILQTLPAYRKQQVS
ncbi:Maltodextrin transport system permease protein MdxF [Paenibacillus nuruki]|uniref:Maltodextrin transport system permease protein MdxF n=2 Tax=Paenibacillus nuruki TaxID=1886670 RepID=A0A1E3L562_9BACL|nr:Maltodextrin transport system permease protein MdxF [Paenibacillus nuruki]